MVSAPIKSLKTCLLLGLVFLFFVESAQAQFVESDERAILSLDEGINFSKDSLFLMNLRFRMQSRAGFNTISGKDLGVDEFEMRVRRLRLRFDGYVLNPKFQYYIQLAFSHSDLNLENQDKAQLVRDAILYYNFNENFYIGFGQSKLPGNRQRVNSSGNLQFADRSIVNSTLTLDRDFGFFGYYTFRMPQSLLMVKGAVTTGDGRNASAINNGLAYTGRAEFLPFGAFENSGDYSEGDLEYEETPKLSVGAAFSKNFKATKTGGQLGQELYGTRDLTSVIVDAIFKYRGWAASSEYIRRDTDNPITTNNLGDIRHVFTGYGINTQLSKMVSRKTEVALRYAFVDPEEEIESVQDRIDETIVGVTRYLNGHRIKIQGNIGYKWLDGDHSFDQAGNHWTGMLQVEFGI
jgi:phosphate-selective porin OprO/OprP